MPFLKNAEADAHWQLEILSSGEEGGGGGLGEAGWGKEMILVHGVWSEVEDFKVFNTLKSVYFLEWYILVTSVWNYLGS